MVDNKHSIYLHIPFCSKKCPYCHFFVTSSKNKNEPRFLGALFQEWEIKKPIIPKDNVISLYLGGGTPTELSAESLFEIISRFYKYYPSLQEITFEANPESITEEKLQAIESAGANRISIGVQSFRPNELITLKRQHAALDAKQAIFLAKSCGIDNISIDLMYDLPDQTPNSFLETLKEIKFLPITHLSLYNLVIEDDTPFKRQEFELKKRMAKEEDSYRMLKMAINELKIAGLKRYEISAFAKDGYTSLHNSGYWLSRPFTGLGPSAFSDDGKKRSQNICHLENYYKKVESKLDPIHFFEELDQKNRFLERFIIRLRMFTPIEIKSFIKQQGLPPKSFFAKLELLKTKNYIDWHHDLVLLTETGADFFEELAVELI